ncbi:MAG: LppX_LprAFG lipoprotein [Candidatus Dormibacteria bacterium]
MTRALWVLGTCTALFAVGSCGGAPPNPTSLLDTAKRSIDAAQTAHFTLTSSNVPAGADTVLQGGSGDMRRPDGFSGSLDVSVSGFTVNVAVVSVSGRFYARDPLSGRFTLTDPTTYGFADPGQLANPQSGLSSLLPICANPTLQPDDRLSGEQLHEVKCSLPGHAVAALLTSADASKPVAATIGVDSNSGELRRVVLTGPFFSATQTSTFTLVVDKFGENVTITPPATT